MINYIYFKEYFSILQLFGPHISPFIFLLYIVYDYENYAKHVFFSIYKGRNS